MEEEVVVSPEEVEIGVARQSEQAELERRASSQYFSHLTPAQLRWRKSFLHFRIARAFSFAGECGRSRRLVRRWRVAILKVIALNHFLRRLKAKKLWKRARLKLRAVFRFTRSFPEEPRRLKRCADIASFIKREKPHFVMNRSLLSPRFCSKESEEIEEEGNAEDYVLVPELFDSDDDSVEEEWNKLLKNSCERSTTSGDFEPLRVIGTGGSGQVYLVQHIVTRQRFAMKVLNKAEIEASRKIERVTTEREILVKAHESPFLTRLKFAFTSENMLFFVMEICEGGNLHEVMLREYEIRHRSFDDSKYRLAMEAAGEGMGLAGALKYVGFFPSVETPRRKRSLTSSSLSRAGHPLLDFGLLPSHVQFIVAEVIEGLLFLHDMGAVYRDLKPQNIMLNVDGHVRIGDFGISKLGEYDATTDKVLLRSNSFIGTLEYMAPEVVSGDPQDSSIDCWGLGVLVYELLYGAPPFLSVESDCNRALFRQILTPERSLQFPSSSKNSQANHFVRSLLHRVPKDRMTLRKCKSHPFLDGINWNSLHNSSGFHKLQPRIHLHRQEKRQRKRPVSMPIGGRSPVLSRSRSTPIEIINQSKSASDIPVPEFLLAKPNTFSKRMTSWFGRVWRKRGSSSSNKKQEILVSRPRATHSVDKDDRIVKFHSGHTIERKDESEGEDEGESMDKEQQLISATDSFVGFDWKSAY